MTSREGGGMRVLVTGSREVPTKAWQQVRDALLAAVDGTDGPHILVHGGAKGADRIAANVAANLGWSTEEHRADWSAPCRPSCDHNGRRRGPLGDGGICPAAGHYRNQHMVDLGADVCVAVFRRGARNAGTADCKRRAVRAGIDVKAVVV